MIGSEPRLAPPVQINPSTNFNQRGFGLDRQRGAHAISKWQSMVRIRKGCSDRRTVLPSSMRSSPLPRSSSTPSKRTKLLRVSTTMSLFQRLEYTTREALPARVTDKPGAILTGSRRIARIVPSVELAAAIVLQRHGTIVIMEACKLSSRRRVEWTAHARVRCQPPDRTDAVSMMRFRALARMRAQVSSTVGLESYLVCITSML